MAISNEGRVGPGEAMAIAVVFIVTKVFLTFPANIVSSGLSAAWLMTLLVVLFAIIAFLPLVVLLKKFPGRTIVEIGDKLVGPNVNILFCLGYLAFFFSVEAMVLRQFAERALTVAVPDLPISIAVLGLVLGGVVAAYYGIETIGRTTRISFFFVGILFALVILLTYPYWELNNIFPVLGPGPAEIVSNGAINIPNFSEIFILALIYPVIKLSKGSELSKIGLTSMTISGIIFIVIVFTYSLTFPVPVAREIPLPTFEMARLIYFGNFVQRLEPIFLPMWGLAALLNLSIGLYAILSILTRMLNLPYYRPFILPVAVIVISFAFIPPNVSTALAVEENVIRVWGWIPTFVLPVILLALSILRKKGGKFNEKVN